RNPVFVFEVKLSRAPGKGSVSVNYATFGNNAEASSQISNVSGAAILHATSVKYKIYVPVLAPLVTNSSNYIFPQPTHPLSGVLGLSIKSLTKGATSWPIEKVEPP